MALGILLEDRVQWSPAMVGTAAALLAALRLRTPVRWALAAEFGIGVALGALALALSLHAPVPMVGNELVPVRLLAAPRPSAGGCRLLLWIYGDTPGRGLVTAPVASCAWLPGQHALARRAAATLWF